jgi:hypothetical protein
MDPQIHTGLIEAFICPRVPVEICFRRGRKHAKHEEMCAFARERHVILRACNIKSIFSM